MNAPTVSVVLATRNYGKYVSEAIESVIAQTFTEWELLIFDDGSTDNTAGVIQPYLSDPRIRYIPSNWVGQPRAKNLGVWLTRGEFIAFLDGDDRWLPGKLAAQLDCIRQDPQVALVTCRRIIIDANGHPKSQTVAPLHRGEVLDEMFNQNFVCFSSTFIRRAVLEHVGYFDTTIDVAIDYELWLRVTKHYRIDFVDEELVEYRTGHANLSSRPRDRLITVMRIMDRFVRERQGSERIAPAQLARSWAETYQSMASVVIHHSFWQGLGWLARAIGRDGGRWITWKRSLGILRRAR